MKKKLSIIYSFRNESENLNELIRRTKESLALLANYDYEIIFVNDASTDDSAELLASYANNDPYLKIVTTKSRYGQVACTLAGFERSQGDAVIYLDADLQDPPELMPNLVQKWEQGNELVHTVRNERYGESALKLFLTSLAYKIIRMTSKVEIPVNAGDYKLVDRKVIDLLLKNFREESPYFRAIFCWLTTKQAFVYYNREQRHAGRSHFPLWSLEPFETFFIGWTSFSTFPLYFPWIAFFACLLLSGGIVIGLLLGALSMSMAIMASLTVYGLCILFCLGLMGPYIARLHLQSRNRPLYIEDV